VAPGFHSASRLAYHGFEQGGGLANLRDIRRRIRTVRKTQQITRAMRMVAAAKLRRAQNAILAARPYSQRIWATLYEVGRREAGLEHPLLRARERRERLEVLVITSDRGLCGSYNANAVKAAEAAIAEQKTEFREVVVSTIGQKGTDYFKRRRPLVRSWRIGQTVEWALAVDVAQHVAERYEDRSVDGVVVVFNEFVSALTQRPLAVKLLPLVPDFSRLREYEAAEGREPYTIEPDPQALMNTLVPQALEYSIWRGLLENQAGEFAARMTAMEAATRNTQELIRALDLQYNRARQAAITRELVEIVSGAEALKS
jgi:F-type H+-transporting ATPase subunit gamma